MKYYLILGLLLICITSGCAKTTYICSNGEEVSSKEQCTTCGNNICDPLEDHCSCPNDCEIGKVVQNCPADRPFRNQHTNCCENGCTPGVSC